MKSSPPSTVLYKTYNATNRPYSNREIQLCFRVYRKSYEYYEKIYVPYESLRNIHQ